MKRFFGLAVLIVFCTASLFAGSQQEEDETYTYDNPYVATFLSNYQGEGIERTDDTPKGMVLREKFNFVLDYIVDEGNVEEKLAIMLAAKDYPDMVWVSNSFLHRYIEADAILPLDDLLKEAPNYVKRYAPSLPYMRFGMPEDKLYTFAGDTSWFGEDAQYDLQLLHWNSDIAIRYDILEAAGWPDLRNSDDYVDFITEQLKKNPKTNGMNTIGLAVGFAAEWGLQGIAPALNEKAGPFLDVHGNLRVVMFDVENYRFVNMIENAYSKESYEFFNKLWRSGALDRDCFTDFSSNINEKVNGPNPPIAYWYALWSHNNIKRAADPGNEKKQYIGLPIVSPTQYKNNVKHIKKIFFSSPAGVVLTDAAKHPERIVEIFDYLATDEGAILAGTGVEGTHWVRDANGKRVLTPFMQEAMKDSAKMDAEGFHFNFLREFGRPIGIAADGQPFSYSAFGTTLFMTDLEKDAIEKMGWGGPYSAWLDPKYAEQTPRPVGFAGSVMIPPTEEAELYALEERIVDYRVKKSAEVIKADSPAEFDRLYQEMVDECDKMGANDIVDWYNTEYKRLESELKRLEKIKIQTN